MTNSSSHESADSGRLEIKCVKIDIGADCMKLKQVDETVEYTQDGILSKYVLIAGTQCCDGARTECENLRTEKRTFVSPARRI